MIVLELLNPTYDEASGTLTYGATILDDYEGEGLAHIAARQQDAMLRHTFGRTSLFVDDCATPDLMYCVSPDTNVIVGVGYQNMCWSLPGNACITCGGGCHGVADLAGGVDAIQTLVASILDVKAAPVATPATFGQAPAFELPNLDGDPATEDAEAVMLLAFDEAFWKIDDIRILDDAATPVA